MTGVAPARWAVRCAHAVPWLLAASALWRLPFAFGFDMGMIDPDAPPWEPWVVPYTLGLIALVEGLGLLTVGLVAEWGERVPAWVPGIGGRPTSPRMVGSAALCGGLALTVLWTADAAQAVRGEHLDYRSPLWWSLGQLALATHVAWGPLLLAVTFDYWRRHARDTG